jgi:hypothetical protein
MGPACLINDGCPLQVEQTLAIGCLAEIINDFANCVAQQLYSFRFGQVKKLSACCSLDKVIVVSLSNVDYLSDSAVKRFICESWDGWWCCPVLFLPIWICQVANVG